jgi:ribosomal-protein-alanine N-acetyltransferase
MDIYFEKDDSISMKKSRSINIKDQFIIRDYQNSDYPEVEKLWIETSLGDEKRGDTAEVIKESLILGGKLLVMMHKATGIIIGTSWMTYDGRRIHLHHFGIKPEFQNRGLGKWLTIESLKFARVKKKQIKLEVHRENKNAIHLYLTKGFEYLGDYNVYILRDPDQMDLSS